MKPVKDNLYSDIKSILEQARSTAVRAVNFSMVLAYWQIGKRIVEEEQQGNKKANYGDYLLKNLAQKLTIDFGKGFNEQNLRNFRQFYVLFSDHSIRYALRSKLQSPDKLPIHDALRHELS